MVADGELLDFTVFPPQPWLNIPEIASQVVTIATDPEAAIRRADILAQEL